MVRNPSSLLNNQANMTEEQMLAGCINLDPQAQELLYSRYCPKMLGLCYRYAGNRADAEDILQEGFIRVFSHLRQFRNDGPIEGWIRKIMIHTSISFLKRKSRLAEVAKITHASSASVMEATAPSIMHAKQIIECIRLLPTGYRTILNLYAIEGYSHREISGLLEIEEVTSRSQYFRAKAMLEKILRKRGLMESRDSRRDNHKIVSAV